MGTEERSGRVGPGPREVGRRTLLTAAGAGGVVLLAAKPAAAGHDGDIALHLGEANVAPPGAETQLFADVDGQALNVQNGNSGAAADGIRGATSSSSPGAAGLRGHAGAGIGVDGFSDTGIGILGHSPNGTGGHFESPSGQALRTDGQVNMSGSTPDKVLHVHNDDTGDPASAIHAFTHGLKAIIASSDNDHEFGNVGVEGVSSLPGDDGYGLGPGFGLQGVTGTGAGVRGVSQSGKPGGFDRGPGIGVLGSAGAGTGVMGTSNAPGDGGFGAGDGVGVEGQTGTGVAVRAVAAGGRAIEAHGRAAFSTAGNGTVPRSRRQHLVLTSGVTADSHVTVTPTSDPGASCVDWVERVPALGFRIHLAATAVRPITFSYLVVEPA